MTLATGRMRRRESIRRDNKKRFSTRVNFRDTVPSSYPENPYEINWCALQGSNLRKETRSPLCDKKLINKGIRNSKNLPPSQK
jgi:hypothetical protein